VVLRLTIVTNLVACSTGMSPGFAPLRILSTKQRHSETCRKYSLRRPSAPPFAGNSKGPFEGRQHFAARAANLFERSLDAAGTEGIMANSSGARLVGVALGVLPI
jgi:hypothetical protein